ncbi:MAG: RNA polymerase sigma factor, partial [Pyrinomonadaceae bacterium]
MESVPPSEINTHIGHLFRHHAGQMAGVLCRIFGVGNIDLIDDSIQDAMVTALKRWPFTGTPANPTAWLTQVAKNRVIDRLRRDRACESLVDSGYEIPAEAERDPYFAHEISEDQLRMIFACCHPSIPPDSQVALTLKIVGGFSVSEIARAYLSTTEAVAKLLTRARAKLRSGGVPLEIPSRAQLAESLSSVLRVLYLMFNEGYSPTGGDEAIRKDLCLEAMRLTGHLSVHEVTRSPRVHALAALFCFQAARFPARIRDGGEILLLADQDRRLWDRGMIDRGLKHLANSADGDEVSNYHLEAEIASLHSAAGSFADTDWPRILECYNHLQSRKYSPVVELNRIVAIGLIGGPR